jgi:chondroitin AC lyase
MHFALLLAPLLLSFFPCVLSDDFDVVRQRVLNAYVYPPRDQLPSIATQAAGLASSLNSSCLWPDINYWDHSRAIWAPFTHISRVSTLAIAVATPGSPVFGNASLTASLHCALDSWLFARPHFTSSNWWFSWIGENLSLQATFLVLANLTSASEEEQLVNFSYNSSWWTDDWGGGDNLSDMLKIQLFRGLASHNISAVVQAFSVLYSTASVGHVTTPGMEGICDDDSYHFHGIQMLSGSYGAGWASTMLTLYSVAAGTEWAMPPAAVSSLSRLLAQGDFAVTFGRRFDFGIEGRGIDRVGDYFSWPFASGALRALATDASAQPWAETLGAFANALDGASAPQPASSKHFWTVDFYAHKRPTWGAAWKGHGDNGLWAVVGNECDNGENTKGELTGAGVLNVYSSAEPDNAVEAYGDIFPLLNWTTINGVTAEQRNISTCGSGDQWPVINTAFVGGVTDGRSGAVAHDTAQPKALLARRAFIFFDQSVVAFGNNVSGFSALPVRTALITRALPYPADDARGLVTLGFKNGSSVSVPDSQTPSFFSVNEVQWIAAGGVVTILPLTSPSSYLALAIAVGNVTGDYAAIGPYHKSVTRRVVTAYIDHGVSPRGSSFAYILAPNVSMSAAPSVALSNSGVSCIYNADDAQSAAEPSNGALAAVVWSPTGANLSCSSLFPPSNEPLSLSVDRDAIILSRVNSTHLVIHAAHPALYAAGASVHVTVNRLTRATSACAPGAGATVVSLALPPSGPFMGSTVVAECELQ